MFHYILHHLRRRQKSIDSTHQANRVNPRMALLVAAGVLIVFAGIMWLSLHHGF